MTAPPTPSVLRLLTQAEVCALLKVHRDTLWRWNRSGRLPAVSLGVRSVRYHEADVSRLLRFYQPESPSKRGPKRKLEQTNL